MEVKIADTIISLVKGDITCEKTDAIVNAANPALTGGGGVDGAIHRVGGYSIMDECRKIGGCPTGTAVVTGAGRLGARYVIHTVGPVYGDANHNEPTLLASAYISSLRKATELGLETVAFPSISTGIYGYPIEEASRIAIASVIDYVAANEGISMVRFVLFSERDLSAYSKSLQEFSRR